MKKPPNVLLTQTDYNVGGVHTTQLFDLQQDPDQIRNLAGDYNYLEGLNRLG